MPKLPAYISQSLEWACRPMKSVLQPEDLAYSVTLTVGTLKRDLAYRILTMLYGWVGGAFQYQTFKDTPENLREQISDRGIKPFEFHSFSLRETHEALKEIDMPWLAALMFFSTHIFRYSRVSSHIPCCHVRG